MTEHETPEELQIRLNENIRMLRDAYSNEIPENIVHSTDENNKFKVRGAWWAALGGNLRVSLREGTITDPLVRSNIENFLDTPKSEMTTKEDIDRANKIINIVLGDEPPEDIHHEDNK